jgi:hypothetical protein
MSTESNIVLFKICIDEVPNLGATMPREPAIAHEDLPEAFRAGADCFYDGFLTQEQIALRLNKMGITQRTLDALLLY